MKTISLIKRMLIIALVGLTTIVNAQNKIYLGVRVPQMNNADRSNIGAESNTQNARGQLIFNTETGKLQYWDGTKWVQSDEANVDVTSKDGTIGVDRDGSNFDLSVNVKTVADSLALYISNTILGDSILSYIAQNIDNPTFNLGDVIQEYIANNFSTALGDTILNYITNNFPTELGDEILNYITNNFPKELGDEVLNYITNNVTQSLTDSIMANVNIGSANNTVIVAGSGTSDIDLSVNVSVIADSLVSNNTFVTNLGDELVSNENFMENITNVLYDDTHLKQLLDSIASLIKDGADVSEFIQEIVNQITQETHITQIGDSLAYYFSQTNLGDTILNYITNNFPAEIGDVILEYITNNVTQSLTDSIMANVNIGSANNTVIVTGSGTSDIDLSVNVSVIADSLVSNNTFVTNLGDELVSNENFMENITNVLYDDTHLKQLLDSIASLIKDGADVSEFIQEIVNQITQETHITQIGDSLAYYFSQTSLGDTILNYITNNFPDEIGDVILNYITNNVTQELTDSIMANVAVKGKYGIEIEGSGTSNITVKLPEGQKEGQVLLWDNTQSAWKPADQTPSVKQVTIAVQNGSFDTKNLIFYGTTSAASSPLKVVAIEPIFSNQAMRRNFLNVDATVQVVGNAADWTVSIENRNISAANQCTLQSVVISYICDDAAALTNGTQGITEISGY